jgi:predicted nucleotidyltransferase
MRRRIETNKVDLLLDSRYDIELEDYWNLSEEDKNDLAILVVTQVHKGFKNLHNLPHHLSQLDDRRMEAVEDQEYERADMIKRIIKKTIEFYD